MYCSTESLCDYNGNVTGVPPSGQRCAELRTSRLNYETPSNPVLMTSDNPKAPAPSKLALRRTDLALSNKALADRRFRRKRRRGLPGRWNVAGHPLGPSSRESCVQCHPTRGQMFGNTSKCSTTTVLQGCEGLGEVISGEDIYK